MDILEIMEILRNKFSKNRFFVRVYNIEPEILIYNDVDIILKYNINLFKNLDRMFKKIMDDIKKKIEEKYNVPNDKVSVIIPTYNNHMFFKQNLEDVL